MNKIEINKTPCFMEVWHEGFVEHEGEKHMFWLIDPQRMDKNGLEYNVEIRWFFRDVPREVRSLQSLIIESYLNEKK